jgi:hypothetical protein
MARPGTAGAVQLPSHWSAFAGGGPGQRLPDTVQRRMESVFGTRFDDVRVHVGPQAAALGALAFTHGSNIYFAPGQYGSAHQHGQRLLAHELAHVVQQRTGHARNPFGSGVAVLQDPLLEAEAERMALRAVSHREPAPPARASAVQPALARPDVGRPQAVLQRSPGRVIQRVHEDALTAISGFAKAHEQTLAGKKKKKIEEIQAMYMGGNVVISSNYPAELDGVIGQFSRANNRGKAQAAVEAMGGTFGALFEHIQTASTSSNAASAGAGLRGGGGRLIILSGASSDSVRFHAEQNLLLVLAHYLNAGGGAPALVEIRGIKNPCDTCARVFAAFNTAYQTAYGQTINFSRGAGEGRAGSAISKLDLKQIFPSASGNFATFVDTYHALAFPRVEAEEKHASTSSSSSAPMSSRATIRTVDASPTTVRNRRGRRATDTVQQPPVHQAPAGGGGWGWRATTAAVVGVVGLLGTAYTAYLHMTAQSAPDPARPAPPRPPWPPST